ncbi:MAG TPA: urate hydroxylase PuuD, partial [Burkholderiales bacterium]
GEWLNLLLRWAHVIAGIAWVGVSLYFVSLESRGEPAAARLQATRHWFKWEAYWTWITGFALLASMYYFNAEAYLIDTAVMPLSKWAAIAVGLGTLVLGLGVYEGLCRSPLGRNDLALGGALLAFFGLTAWGLTQVFSGRGAFIHYGAILGTIMVGNVAHVIIPGERRMARASSEGRAPDAKDARMGRQRSMHNTYLALPVVLAMLSNHYAIAFGHRRGWLVLVALTLAGVLARAWFVQRHRGRAPAWAWIAGAMLVAIAAVLIAPSSRQAPGNVSFSDVKTVIDARCLVCHAEKPAFRGFIEAPKGVKLDTPERIRAQAPHIYRQTVLSTAMPPGNLTGATEEERALLDRWYRAGAATK